MASESNVNVSKRPPRIISEAARKKREEQRLRYRQIAYRLNPPRWSLQWWKNRAVKWLRTPYDLPPVLFWRVFWWIYRTFFARYIWYKHGWPGEAPAMRLVRENTTIPVPRVWLTVDRGHYILIFMERIPGTTLKAVWLDSSEEERENYIMQLAEMLPQLRTLRSPFGSRICDATGGPVVDWRVVPPPPYPDGPYENEEVFNKRIAQFVPRPRPSPEMLGHTVIHPIRFTHSDIAPRNIMVRDGRVISIIDWGNSGWFPAHWEYIKTYWANNPNRGEVDRSFTRYIDRFLERYPRELEIDQNYIYPWPYEEPQAAEAR